MDGDGCRCVLQLGTARSHAFNLSTTLARQVDKGGEDAYFLCSSGTVLGVVDGVGGWSEDDVDPALYAGEWAFSVRVNVGFPHA